MIRPDTSSSAVFSLPDNERMAHQVAGSLGASVVPVTVDRFPDGEALVRFSSSPKCRDGIIVCSLDRPDEKVLPLVFAAGMLREMGTMRVGLVAPYLAYMRQDQQFHEGEATSAVHFASLLSSVADWMVTVEPHLHRISALDQVYSIPTACVHVAADIAQWITQQVPNGVVIGPDAESRQWARAVAEAARLPYVILKKIRLSSDHVEVSVPDVERWRDRVPVLVDDVISTGHTMSETARVLRQAGLRPPICVAVHAVFAGDAYRRLLGEGVARIVTTTTIPHVSNAIDVSARVAAATASILQR